MAARMAGVQPGVGVQQSNNSHRQRTVYNSMTISSVWQSALNATTYQQYSNAVSKQFSAISMYSSQQLAPETIRVAKQSQFSSSA
jgi:hypothetical protein